MTDIIINSGLLNVVVFLFVYFTAPDFLVIINK